VTAQLAASSNRAPAAPVVVFGSTVAVAPSVVVTVAPAPPVGASSPHAASRPPRLTVPSAPSAWRRLSLVFRGSRDMAPA
jgi:hypothetical protein